MGEAIMKKFLYSIDKGKKIIAHENRMLQTYTQQMRQYVLFFEKKGYSLDIGLFWMKFPHKKIFSKRIKFQSGYECYIYCEIQKDGVPVYINSSDGEADYYPLSTASVLSSIRRWFFKKYAFLFSDMGDIEEILHRFLSQLS